MRVRLYSFPDWGGDPNVGASLSVSYVFAGGGTVGTRLGSYAYTLPERSLPNNVMGNPQSDEIFTLDGVNRHPLQTGDVIQLRASDGHYVGIYHDEDDHSDYLVVNDSQAGIGDSFIVTAIDDPGTLQVVASVNNLDPCGPPQPIYLLGAGNYSLAFPNVIDGPLDLFFGNAANAGVEGGKLIFAIDFLPDLPLVSTPWRRR